MADVNGVKRPRVIIVGAGFGGIHAAKALAGKDVDVTIIDCNNYHLFQPLLYQVSTAVLAENEIAYPVRAFFRQKKNIDFFLGRVTDFDPQQKRVITDAGELSYDYLIVAAGATTNYFGMDSVAKHAFSMKTLNESVAIRNHILNIFEQASKESDVQKRRELLTFVCVGGGPTGVEEAGAISELIYSVMAKEYHHMDFSEVDVKLIEGTDRILPMMPKSLRDEALQVLRGKKVDVRLETQVMNYDGRELTFKGGSVVKTRTVIWAAGVKAVPVMAKLGAPLDRAGRVIVRKTLQVPGCSDVYAIGDSACFMQDDRPLATIAPVATQQAEICVQNILHTISGRPLQLFSYHDIGSMATIGCGDAVMFRGIIKSKGFIAWMLWMVVHLMRLAGTRTNMLVILKWLWNFLSGDRLGRIITQHL